jgi:peptide/nickel transport system substrate-binding protein
MKGPWTKTIAWFVCFVVFVTLPVGCTKAPVEEIKPDQANGGPQFGGTLSIATDAEPAGLDMMVSSATLTWTIAWHMFENLFTLGSKQEVIPMLAENYTLDDAGLVYTIRLRQDVVFHGGKKMTAEDVIASLTRWLEVSSTGKSTGENLNDIKALNDYEVQITLNKPDSVFLASLAIPSQGAIIIPKELAEKAGNEPMKEFIGTGPFEFIEWKPNQHIRLKRFDDYKPRTEPTNGYGGEKIAYVDELYYTPVPDATVQATGVETGQFDYAYAASSDDYDLFKETPGLQTVVSDPRAWLAFILNTKEGIMANLKVRQAFLAALSMEDILLVSRGHRDIWRMDPSLNQKETIWWSDKGKELYNQGDVDKAKRLLQEAGYDGEPIRWMASYEGYYNAALTAKSQLEEAGFVIDLQKYEPSTESDRRKDPALWDVSVTGYTMRPDPVLNTFMSSSVPGWWENAEVQGLLEDMRREVDFDKRYAMWERIQELFYEEVPYVKVGDYATLRLLSERVQNFKKTPDIFFWNVWLEQE